MWKLSIFILCSALSHGQILISDDFSDGNYHSSPTWAGQDSLFIVNAQAELQLMDQQTGSAYLTTPSAISDSASWRFYVRMEFNPSSANHCRLYVISDQSNLNAGLQGYYLRIGGSTADRVSLYRQDGLQSILLLQSAEDWVDDSTVELWVDLSRDEQGLWTLKLDSTGVLNYQLIDTVTDLTYRSSVFFGLLCHYTTTRSDKFFFDDFRLSGRSYRDRHAPELLTLQLPDSSSVLLEFNETLASWSFNDTSLFWVDGGIGHPQKLMLESGDSSWLRLRFGAGFENGGVYQLQLLGPGDKAGNRLFDSLSFRYYRPGFGDIVFNELMVDPSPVVGSVAKPLPGREYIELFNRKGFSISLNNWRLQIGSIAVDLPDSILNPHGFGLLVEKGGILDFNGFSGLVGVAMSSSSLTNSGNELGLYDSTGQLISQVNYRNSWYGDENKKEGGWALEKVDPDNLCEGATNWQASKDLRGGTPSEINSVRASRPDTTPANIAYVGFVNDHCIELVLDEMSFDPRLSQKASYRITPELGIDSVRRTLLGTGVEICFEQPMEPDLIYSLSLSGGHADCNGNPIVQDTLQFGLPAVPEPGNLVINELLFNPHPGGSDFVELHNCSDKLFDLQELRMANWDPIFGSVSNSRRLSDVSRILAPGQYLVLTSDPDFLKANYRVLFPNRMVKPSQSLPSMPDDEGHVALLSSNLSVIVDKLGYSDDMHLNLLGSDEGVSIERVLCNKPSEDHDNWHSASATAGYATPGYENSHAARVQPGGKLHLSPEVFSPNNDGYKDMLQIHYTFPSPNYMVSVSIWSVEGYELRRLNRNVNVATSGLFVWNGTNDGGELLNSGIYIVILEYFSIQGDSGVLKASCVLAR